MDDLLQPGPRPLHRICRDPCPVRAHALSSAAPAASPAEPNRAGDDTLTRCAERYFRNGNTVCTLLNGLIPRARAKSDIDVTEQQWTAFLCTAEVCASAFCVPRLYSTSVEFVRMPHWFSQLGWDSSRPEITTDGRVFRNQNNLLLDKREAILTNSADRYTVH